MAKSSKSTLDSAKKSLKNFEAKQIVSDHRVKVRARDNSLAVIVTAAVILIASASQFLYFNVGPGVSPNACITSTPTPLPSVSGKPNPAQIPDPAISECRDWSGSIIINGKSLGVTLHGQKAPQAVGNFVYLAETSGFYNGISCHRLTTSGIYVLQCGDPQGNGSGGPGYSFGPVENAPPAAKGSVPTYKKGWLAMARTQNSATSMGSQFFIVYADSQIPDDVAGGYTVFGEVTSGLAGLDPIIKAGTKSATGDGVPKVKTTIQSITLK
ncbi:MAG: peptidylprolyl isomerase [Actinomycetes bacterium]